jgi:hypothetical protein
MSNNNNPSFFSKNVKDNNIDTFGDFKSAPTTSNISSNTSTGEFIQMMKKLDDIMYQLGVLRSEVKEMKQTTKIFTPQIPAPIIYPVNPTYPGQPMPPYPYQQQLNRQYNPNL